MPRLATIPALALSLLAAGCAAQDSTASAMSQARIPALVAIGESGQKSDIPQVLPSLASDDPLVRWTAQRTLLNLTGTTNGYDWAADRNSRERAIQAWRNWCVQQGIPEAGKGRGHA